MCDLCRWEPCHPSCPNAIPPEVVERCFKCGTELYEGDECYEIDERYVCEECVGKMRITL